MQGVTVPEAMAAAERLQPYAGGASRSIHLPVYSLVTFYRFVTI